MQYHFVDGLDTREAVARLVLSQIAILRRCQKEDIPVVVLEYVGCGATIEDLETELAKLQTVIRIAKSNESGFSNPELDDALRGLGVGTLFLMGINAEACVLETAQDARRLGYAVVTNSELIASANANADIYSTWYRANGVFVEKVPETLQALAAPKTA